MALTTVDFPLPVHYSKRIVKTYPGSNVPVRKIGSVHKNSKSSRKP